MTRRTLWSSTLGDVPANLAFTNNFEAIVDPGIGNDSSQNYSVGSVWVNTATDVPWMCSDPTEGAAVWVPLSEGSSIPGQIQAPDASSATGAGSAARIRGGAGGSTSGAGGAAKVTGGAATSGAGGASSLTGGAGGTAGAGGAASVAGGVGGATNAVGGVATLTGGAGQGTGNGAAASVAGGASGAGSTGDGGAANVSGGAAASSNGNGGSVVLSGGAKAGSGIAGGIRNEGLVIRSQGAPAAKTVSATLTAAELLSGIITVNQGGAAASALQVPTGTAILAGLPADFAVGDSFDVSVINISTVDAEDASLTVNTDVTLVGSMDFLAYSAAGLQSSGIVRFRMTSAHVFVGYRIG